MVLGKRVLPVLMIAAVVAVMGVSPSWGAKTPYVVGAIFTTTGDNAPLGVPERDTVQMLVDQINKKGGVDGHPIKVEIFDDAGNPQQAAQACRTLLDNKNVVAIIGPTLTGPSLAINQMCQAAKMPLVSCAASIKIVDPVKSYVFKTAEADSLVVARLLDYLKKKKIKSVGFISDSNAFGASGRDQWLRLSRNAGIKTVALESFNTSDTSMTSQLTKIRAAKPDAVVCWGTNPGPAVVAKDMKRLGMKQPLLMSHGVANATFIKLAGSSAEGVIIAAGKLLVANSISSNDIQKKTLLQFANSYQNKYKKPANPFGGYAHDALMLVVNALDKVGPNKAKIRSTIEKNKKYVGVSGIFGFSPKDHAGLKKESFALLTVKGGKWVLAK